MLPFFEQPVFKLGPISIHAFGILISIAIYVALAMAHSRFRRFGLNEAVGDRMGGWILVGTMLGAHWFSVLAYFPDQIAKDPWLLLRIWEDISSFGGMLGGMLAATVFLWSRFKGDEAPLRWLYLDIVVFVFPFAFAIGRAGCALAHDHPGTITNFPLTFSLKTDAARDYIVNVYSAAGLGRTLPGDSVLATMGFHDLGWYEFLYLSLVVIPVMLVLDKRNRTPGFSILVFAALYLPVRFAFDCLRVSDIRYAGLTPGQWVAIIALFALPFLWRNMRSRPRYQPQISEPVGEGSIA
ncbi:MAG: prolipoprotein diacylglyceryl transferase family protein [Gemmatimonadaceae bacterium]